MVVFGFITLSDESEDFSRISEVPKEMDLVGFHDFIRDDLGYDPSSFSSFFKSDGNWDKLLEYTLIDVKDDSSAEGAMPMADTLLGDIVKDRRDRLIFMFDIFAGRSFFLELRELKEPADNMEYPRVESESGDIPPQFGTGDSFTISEEGIFDDAFDEFSNFDGTEYYDDEL